MNGLPKEWDELQKKFSEYLSIIVRDHHKNRDGKIILSYEYDGWREEGQWVVCHNGYVNDFCIVDSNREKAVIKAIEEVNELIRVEREYIDNLL